VAPGEPADLHERRLSQHEQARDESGRHHFGSEEQQAGILAELLAGERIAAWALAEPRPHDRLGNIGLEATTAGDSVVLSGAKHPIAAQLWINFNLDAKISANNTNYIGYMGPNAAAEALIDPAITGDQRLNPPQSILDKLVELLYLPPADLDKYTKRWTELRA